MPFDGTLYDQILVEKKPAPVVCRKMVRHRRRICIEAWLMAIPFLAVGWVVDHMIFPDYGISTRLIYGNAIADRNSIAVNILRDDPYRLRFTVAGHQYQVVTPRHPLTQEQQEAWLGYWAWVRLPFWKADGPLAIDP